MEQITEKIKNLDWKQLKDSLDQNGYAVIPDLVHSFQADDLIGLYDKKDLYRSVIEMKRYNFGIGEYKYFSYPLPHLVQQFRTQLYPYLAKIANSWMNLLQMDVQYPVRHQDFLDICHEAAQNRPTPLILQYQQGDYNTLHQDLYGEVYFPFQAVLFLTESGKDYTGGEFILLEQKPRMQSKAKVLQLKKGEILIFTTNYRPVEGARGYYRATMKHGVSEITSGKRYNLGIIFHDAK